MKKKKLICQSLGLSLAAVCAIGAAGWTQARLSAADEDFRAEDTVTIDDTTFPDSFFRNYVSDEFDADEDGKLSEEEIAEAKEIIFECGGVADFTGIEYFTELRELVCPRDEDDDVYLTSLNIENNKKLTRLVISGNQIQNLNLSENKELVELECWDCNLKKLDLSANTKLTSVNCSMNSISDLDLSKNTKLKVLIVNDNKFQELDVSALTNLTSLGCSENRLTSLYLNSNTELEELDCSNNSLFELNLSDNLMLKTLLVDNNKLSELYVNFNEDLETLWCTSNNLTQLNVRNNKKLTQLLCANNRIYELDLRENRDLEELWCYANVLTKLNLQNNKKLTNLSCFANSLTELNISANTELRHVSAMDNDIAVIDIMNCPEMLARYKETSGKKVDHGDFSSYPDANNAYLEIDNTTRLLTDEERPSFTIPDYKAMPYQEAVDMMKEELKKAGFANAVVYYAWDPSNYDPDMNAKITQQDPKPGTVITDNGEPIMITLYAGEKAPDFVTITPIPKPTVTDTPTPKPTISATPKPTEKVEPTVTDTPTPKPTVSATPKPTEKVEPTVTAAPTPTPAYYKMPDLKAMPYKEAKEKLEKELKAAGIINFEVHIGYDPNNYDPEMNGNITAQTPAAGEVIIENGKKIEIAIYVAENAPDFVTITPTPVPKIDDFVERLYTVALGREAEAKGKKYWIDEIKAGRKTGADCAEFFLTSPEFTNRKLSIEEFVETLYKTFFNRDSEPKGKAYWVNELKNGTKTRNEVIAGFSDSKEWCNVCATYSVKSGAKTAKAEVASDNTIKFIKRLYSYSLNRNADEKGLEYWSLALTNLEKTGAECAQFFFESPEFANQKNSDDEFLLRLYMAFMDREPDEGGKKFWMDKLKGGTSRHEVLASFISSKEFTNICTEFGIERGEL